MKRNHESREKDLRSNMNRENLFDLFGQLYQPFNILESVLFLKIDFHLQFVFCHHSCLCINLIHRLLRDARPTISHLIITRNIRIFRILTVIIVIFVHLWLFRYHYCILDLWHNIIIICSKIFFFDSLEHFCIYVNFIEEFIHTCLLLLMWLLFQLSHHNFWQFTLEIESLRPFFVIVNITMSMIPMLHCFKRFNCSSNHLVFTCILSLLSQHRIHLTF